MAQPGVLDVAVIGGGIVGCATALALAARPGVRVAVLEAEDAVARHQTGRNSGVIHSGLYYRPGSLKAAHCTAGRVLLEAFCARRGIPVHRCGKLVVATRPGEVPRLEALADRGRRNGLEGLERLGPEGIRAREPAIAGLAGLWVPQTGVVDFGQVAAAMAEALRDAGGAVLTGARVGRIADDGDALLLETTRGAFAARHAINCAGLQSDRVARMAGLRPDCRIVPFRGAYHDLADAAAARVRGLVYPGPDPRFPFLGVHLTRNVHGHVHAGPNAVPAWHRHGYLPPCFSWRDAWDTLTWPGFARMAARHWRMGLGELWRSWSRAAFLAALRRMMPDLQAADLVPGTCGIRAQALGRDGTLLDDFAIAGAGRMLHVLNAPSPAATASLAIGRTVAERAAAAWGLPEPGPDVTCGAPDR